MVRTWISLVIAVVFAIAAMPGSMAMPTPSHAKMSSAMAAMDCCAHADKAPQDKSQDKSDPCKSMAVCFGLLSCHGLAALPFMPVTIAALASAAPLSAAHQSVSGLSIPPDDPPPIVD